jgi:hypothetical protein
VTLRSRINAFVSTWIEAGMFARLELRRVPERVFEAA